MNVVINGEPREIMAGTSIAALLTEFDLKPEATLVQRNDDVVERTRFHDVALEDGDRIELVRMVAGG